MDTPVVEIVRREEFSASHRLHEPNLSDEENRRVFGICNNEKGHGHNYVLEVAVRGRIGASHGMVMNLVELMRIVRERIVDRVDHKHLNEDVDFLADVNPTAENLAVAFWTEIEPELQAYEGCRLHRIRLYESRNNFVDFHGPTVSAPVS